MQFRFCCCHDDSTAFWYGDYSNINFRWQLSALQMRILGELGTGPSSRDALREKLVGKNLSASQRAALSRLLRRMREQNLITVKGDDLKLTKCGQQVHDDLTAAGCKTLAGKPPKPKW